VLNRDFNTGVINEGPSLAVVAAEINVRRMHSLSVKKFTSPGLLSLHPMSRFSSQAARPASAAGGLSHVMTELLPPYY